MAQDISRSGQSNFAQTQELIKSLPEQFKVITHELKHLEQLVWQRQHASDRMLDAHKEEQASLDHIQTWMESLHDRMDALTAETRVTNKLLSELVAKHSMVIEDDVGERRELIRREAYNAIYNGD